MNLIELPITILDKIIMNINDTSTYANLRISCKSFHNLLSEVKKYYNNKTLKDLFIFKNGIISGYYVNWHINGQISSMVLYLNGKREKERIYYYPSGNIKLVTHYSNNMLNGIERHYTNYDKKLLKYIEYKDDKKINDELTYSKGEYILFRKTYISDLIYKLTYYDNNYKIIEGTFVNNVLQGKHTIRLLNSNNNYLYYNKIINEYNYGTISSKTLYKHDTMLERYSFINGKKDGWAFKWHNNHKLKSLCFYNQNNYNKTLKLWDQNNKFVESIDFTNNNLNGFYKSSTKYTSKTIPYVNNKINGYIIEKIKCINMKYYIKFLHNVFDRVIKKENNIFKEEIFLDIDYLSYTKYKYGKKIYSLKLINDYVIVSIYDNKEVKIYDYSKLLFIDYL